METTSITLIDNSAVINALVKYPALLNKIIDAKVIWYPEWGHFKVVRLNDVYLLFEKCNAVFHSTSIETVKRELVERFHFANAEQKM